MTLIDIFAWIVLLVLIATAVAIFVALGMMPGHIARKRNHPWAEAVMVGGWATLIFGVVLWPLVLIWAYVDAPARQKSVAMIVVLLNGYLAILALFVWLRFIPFNLFWKLSPVLVLLALLIGLFIPMNWGAPSGTALVMRNSVQIIPSVAGEVIDVPVQPNVPLKAGDVLLRIDPTTYEAQVQAIEAQLKLAELRLAQFSQLQQRDSGRAFDVEQRQAEVDQLKAQRAIAHWNLDKTTVRAPAAGYVTNLTLRKGARVSGQSAVMAFIDTSDTLMGVEIPQTYARYIASGQPVEMTFKIFPGTIYSGRVETVLQAIASGQGQPTGLAITPQDIQSAPFVVRVKLDDPEVAARLPAGTAGQAAIFTDHVPAAQIIRKVILRQSAIMNYVLPF